MQEFSAVRFYQIGDLISHGKDTLRLPDRPEVNTVYDVFRDTLKLIEKNCSEIGLRQSVKAAKRDLVILDSSSPSYDDLVQMLDALDDRIVDEMEDQLFMFIPPQRADFYGKPELFGSGVNKKFPSIQFDVVEAGNCYASGRGTACVFHLMRIMEIGVQEFGTKLGVTLANEKNWQNILDEINKAIKALPKSAATVEMSQAAANLYAVKLAWRNEVMHPKDTYTLEEADNLIRQVRIFLQQLETIV